MLSGPELWIVLIIVLVLFGGSQLPKLARNLGKAQRELKAGMQEEPSESSSTESDTAKSEKADTKTSDSEKADS